MLQGKILITGGAGTLGRAIIRRATQENWDCQFTIYSTDAAKHALVRARYPKVQCVVGDIRSYDPLYNAMTGKDVVIHAAAVKRIPESEFNSIDTVEVNVSGSLNVATAAFSLGIPKVIGISTDKACHPANAYGCTKMLMEKIWQEYARIPSRTTYNLVRYGNVLESTGSVIEAWHNAIEQGRPIKMTDPEMTRFWLAPSQAVQHILDALECDSGSIYIPKMPALSIGKLAEYVVGADVNTERISLRPGEKMHETLLALEETEFAGDGGEFFVLHPSTSQRSETELEPYTSDNPIRELGQAELREMLENG